MDKKVKVYIDGSEGTTGLRIFERFQERDDVEIIKINPELRKDPAERAKMINASDITFLCLPDAASIEAVSLCTNPEVKIIDASTAHRTNPDWAYGFPELSAALKEKIQNSKRIAVPGCHASGFMSCVYPLVASGLMPKDYPVVCFSLTGYSGGGKKMIAQYEGEDRPTELDAPREYGLTQVHKHLKEMKAITGLENEPIFTPIVDDYYSGMVVSIPVFTNKLTKKMTLAEIRAFYEQYYVGKKFIHVLNEEETAALGGFLAGNSRSGWDGMDIVIVGNDDRITINACFDNLGKGASGAAIQCMNLAIGAAEDTGLVL